LKAEETIITSNYLKPAKEDTALYASVQQTDTMKESQLFLYIFFFC
jgi:hypothetical protein